MEQRREDELFDVFAHPHSIDNQIIKVELPKARNNDQKAEEKIYAEFEYHITAAAIMYCFGNYETLSDLVQEGYLALHTLIHKPNLNYSHFTWRAMHAINTAIRKANYIDPNIIEDHIYYKYCPAGLMKQYKMLLKSYFDQYHQSPSDDFIREVLNITEIQLAYLKHELRILTIARPFYPKEEKMKEEFLTLAEEKVDQKILLATLQTFLNPFEYFVIYQLLQGKTQTAIAEKLRIHSNTVNLTVRKIKEKLLMLCQNKSGLLFKGFKLNSNIDKIRLKPLSLREIAISYYLRNYLSQSNYQIYYDCYASKRTYTDQEIIEKYHLTQEEYDEVLRMLQTEIQAIPEDFLEKLISQLLKGSKLKTVFAMDLSPKGKKSKQKVVKKSSKSQNK